MSQAIQSPGFAQQTSASAAANTQTGPTLAHPSRDAEYGGSAANPAPLFEPFVWHQIPARSNAPGLPAYDQAEFAGAVLDVALGVHDVLGIIERVDLDEGFADELGRPLPPIVSRPVASHLMRLCSAALDLLADRASRYTDRVQQAADLDASRCTAGKGVRHG